jgi:hypothetical protein
MPQTKQNNFSVTPPSGVNSEFSVSPPSNRKLTATPPPKTGLEAAPWYVRVPYEIAGYSPETVEAGKKAGKTGTVAGKIEEFESGIPFLGGPLMRASQAAVKKQYGKATGQTALAALNGLLLDTETLLGAARVNPEQLAATKAFAAKEAGPVKRLVRGIVGAGTKNVERAVGEAGAADEEAIAEHEAKLTEARGKSRQALSWAQQQHEQELKEIADAEKENAEAQAKQAIAKARQGHEVDLADFEKKAAEFKRASEIPGEKRKAVDRLMASTKQAYAAVKAQLDQRWDNLRLKIGNETPVDMGPVADALQTARTKVLRGFPQDLQMFNSMLSEPAQELQAESGAWLPSSAVGGAKGPVEWEIEGGEPAPLTFDAARIRYSSLGAKIYESGGNLPGQVYRALKMVRDALGEQLENTAKAAGQGKQYKDLLADTTEFMNDWRDMSPEARGGSPLARLRQAVDAPVAERKAEGSSGERLVKLLDKYREYGADPDAARQVRDLGEEAKSLGKVKEPAPPGEAKVKFPSGPPTEPKPKGPKISEPWHAKVNLPTVPKAPELQNLTRTQARRAAVESMIKRLGSYGALRATVGIEEMVRQTLTGHFGRGVLEMAGLVGGPAILRNILEEPAVEKWIVEDVPGGAKAIGPMRDAVTRLIREHVAMAAEPAGRTRRLTATPPPRTPQE